MVQEKTIIEVGLKSKMLFKNAKLESIYKLYNKSGNLRFEMPIENNKRESTAIFYWPGGDISAEIQYTNDKINGIVKFYDKEKIIWQANA